MVNTIQTTLVTPLDIHLTQFTYHQKLFLGLSFTGSWLASQGALLLSFPRASLKYPYYKSALVDSIASPMHLQAQDRQLTTQITL